MIERLCLASGSARRLLLLREAGFEPEVISTGVDDGQLSPGPVPPETWTTALAYLKATAGVRGLGAGGRGALVLGADTVVVKAERVIGQPRDAADARRIIGLLEDGEHWVVTGVALLEVGAGGRVERRLLADRSRVRVGRIGEAAIEGYVGSGDWRGKAGAYNLSERIEAGWPVSCEGDPSTVMGLPMTRLSPMLREMMGEPT